MASTITPRLHSYKLNAAFSGKSVSHVTLTSDLEARQRRIEVKTVWNTEDRLGAGAFGVVWRQRADSGQVRAVKVISKAQLNIQEVEAMIELRDHPDLFIRFLGWFEDLDRDTFHIAMEFIEHGHLGTYIAEYKTKVNTKEITSQILEGLVVLHEREICHRDLKPQNILVASLSPIWVKITDFGISKRWVGTSLKTNCGTAIYRSPEQLGFLPREFRAAANSNAYTHNIDIWALGAIVHEMLTLDIPFLDNFTNEDSAFMSGISTVEDTVDTGLLYRYCQGADPFPCGTLRSHGVPEDGIEFVKSLMVVDPSKRLSAAAALASKWLIQIEVTPHTSMSRVAELTEPIATTTKEESRGIARGLEVHPGSSPATSQISTLIDGANDRDICSVGADDSPFAPATKFHWDRMEDTRKDWGIPTMGRMPARSISPASKVEMWVSNSEGLGLPEPFLGNVGKSQSGLPLQTSDQTGSDQAHVSNHGPGGGKKLRWKVIATDGSDTANRSSSMARAPDEPRGKFEQSGSAGTSVVGGLNDPPFEPSESNKNQKLGADAISRVYPTDRAPPPHPHREIRVLNPPSTVVAPNPLEGQTGREVKLRPKSAIRSHPVVYTEEPSATGRYGERKSFLSVKHRDPTEANVELRPKSAMRSHPVVYPEEPSATGRYRERESFLSVEHRDPTEGNVGLRPKSAMRSHPVVYPEEPSATGRYGERKSFLSVEHRDPTEATKGLKPYERSKRPTRWDGFVDGLRKTIGK